MIVKDMMTGDVSPVAMFLSDHKGEAGRVNPYSQPDRKFPVLVFEHFPREPGAKYRTKNTQIQF